MNKTQSKLCLSWLLLALGRVDLAAGACDHCKFTPRGNRHEGVATRQISGGSFDLVAVEYRAAPPTGDGDEVKLYFWLPQASNPYIEVYEPRSNYLMLPIRKQREPGLVSFAWPRAEVITPLGLAVEGLFLKVWDDDDVFYPGYLTAGPAPSSGGTYAFVFQSGAGIDVQGLVSRAQGNELIEVRKLSFQDELGGTLRISWDGRDEQGQLAPPGVYTLRLKGYMLAEVLRPINEKIAFQHYGQLE